MERALACCTQANPIATFEQRRLLGAPRTVIIEVLATGCPAISSRSTGVTISIRATGKAFGTFPHLIVGVTTSPTPTTSTSAL